MSKEKLSRFNPLGFCYYIKERDQIVNFWQYTWFTLKNAKWIILFRSLLVILFTYYSCCFGNFYTINIFKDNRNVVMNMSNLTDEIYTAKYSRNKELNDKMNTKVVNIKNLNESQNLALNFYLKVNNYLRYIKNFTSSFRQYDILEMKDKYILLFNTSLIISLLFCYLIGLAPLNQNPGKLIDTELSWWNPLSIWYGFKKRLMFDSIFSKLLWTLTYIGFIYILYLQFNCYDSTVIIMIKFILFLVNFYSLPRCYNKF